MRTPADSLRILVVTNLWPTGDGFQGVFVAEQVDALRRLGHQVDVEVVARGSTAAAGVGGGRRGKLDYLTAGPRVRRRIRQGGYHVVHVHYGLTALAGSFTGPVPRVLSLHGSDINTPWQRWCTRLGGRGYAARIYVSRRLASTAGDPDGVVIPAGVDFALFTPADRAAARAGLGIAGDERVVLFGGAPGNAVKGYDVFRDVLAAVPGARELILAEPGAPRAAVVTKMAAADALLFTSRKGAEGSPMVVKEAAAVGLPVVSVDVGDVAEVLAGVTPGAVVPFPEPWGTPPARTALVEALAAQLAQVLANPGRSDGRDRVARLDATRVAQRVVEVYRQAIAGARTGADAGSGAAVPAGGS